MQRFYLLLALLLIGCSDGAVPGTPPPSGPAGPVDWSQEIIYHVFQRSFFDADGDGHGDFNGARQQLDYLQELGVTTILFTPIYASHFYHNYYPTDYETIDPRYGTREDYLRFVRAVHARGMKFILDQEVQYASNGHPWFDRSLHYPDSPYADFIYYNDSLNQEPEPGFYHYEFIHTYENKVTRLTHLDLNHPTVQTYMQDYFLYWIDPNGDGVFDDGVDGFRLDHMMDDLDFKGKFTNLYEAFWNPIIKKSKARNPNVFFLAEQATWDYGADLLSRTQADAVFAFPIYRGILAWNARALAHKVDSTLALLPEGRVPVVFIENHDTNRFASEVEEDPRRMRVGAVLNLLLPGVPGVYYGQELGLPGRHGSWGHDGNAIPVREAFPWFADPDADGLALWYKDTGPWWDGSIYGTGRLAALALETQRADPDALFHFYKRLIAVRKTYPVFQRGAYEGLDLKDPGVFAFARTTPNSRAVVWVNLSAQEKHLSQHVLEGDVEEVLTGRTETVRAGQPVVLEPYGFKVWVYSL